MDKKSSRASSRQGNDNSRSVLNVRSPSRQGADDLRVISNLRTPSRQGTDLGSIDVPSRPSTAHTNNVMLFMRELDRIHEQHLVYNKRNIKEKRRKEKLDEEIGLARERKLRLNEVMQNKTPVKIEISQDLRNIAKLEKKLQMAKIKLSVTRGENIGLRNRIDDQRREKQMRLQILSDLDKEITQYKQNILDANKDIAAISDRKHRVKVEIQSMKLKIQSDMEEFAKELETAKKSINETQNAILETIHDRLCNTFSASLQFSMTSANNNSSNLHYYDNTNPLSPSKTSKKITSKHEVKSQNVLEDLLEQTGATSLQDLIHILQTSDDQCFNSYRSIQQLNEELDKIDFENKQYENEIENQILKLKSIEGNNTKIRNDLEQHVLAIQKSIAKYESDYAYHLDVLHTISEGLMMLLKNVAVDDDAIDHHLLSTGITERNIERYLGVMEQRIDEIIQMSKAAAKETISRGDFTTPYDKTIKGMSSTMMPPELPSLSEIGVDDNDNDNNNNTMPVNISLLKENMQRKIIYSGSKPSSNSRQDFFMEENMNNYLEEGPITSSIDNDNNKMIIETRQRINSDMS